MSIEDVSVLLGHSSVQTTERYYAPWDRSRRDRLTRIVRDAHQRDPLLAELYGDPADEPGGAATAAPARRPARAARFYPNAQVHDFKGYTAYP